MIIEFYILLSILAFVLLIFSFFVSKNNSIIFLVLSVLLFATITINSLNLEKFYFEKNTTTTINVNNTTNTTFSSETLTPKTYRFSDRIFSMLFLGMFFLTLALLIIKVISYVQNL